MRGTDLTRYYFSKAVNKSSRAKNSVLPCPSASSTNRPWWFRLGLFLYFSLIFFSFVLVHFKGSLNSRDKTWHFLSDLRLVSPRLCFHFSSDSQLWVSVRMFYCSRFCHFKTVTESCEGALSPPALHWTQSQLWLRKTTAAARVAFMLILLRALILLSVMKAVLFQFYSNSLTKKWNVLDLGVFIFAFAQSPAAFPVCKGGSGRSGAPRGCCCSAPTQRNRYSVTRVARLGGTA